MSNVSINLPSKDGEPAWEAAYFFPPQGRWSEEDFLQFHTNRMAELVDGRLEILHLPTWLHQLIVKLLLASIKEYQKANNYAKAGVREYWIVDPEQSLLTVLTLDGLEVRRTKRCW